MRWVYFYRNYFVFFVFRDLLFGPWSPLSSVEQVDDFTVRVGLFAFSYLFGLGIGWELAMDPALNGSFLILGLLDGSPRFLEFEWRLILSGPWIGGRGNFLLSLTGLSNRVSCCIMSVTSFLIVSLYVYSLLSRMLLQIATLLLKDVLRLLRSKRFLDIWRLWRLWVLGSFWLLMILLFRVVFYSTGERIDF